jgi:hypothetical protein
MESPTPEYSTGGGITGAGGFVGVGVGFGVGAADASDDAVADALLEALGEADALGEAPTLGEPATSVLGFEPPPAAVAMLPINPSTRMPPTMLSALCRVNQLRGTVAPDDPPIGADCGRNVGGGGTVPKPGAPSPGEAEPPWSFHNCQPSGTGPQAGSGCQPAGGTQPSGAAGQFGGGLNFIAIVFPPFTASIRYECERYSGECRCVVHVMPGVRQ